MTLSNAGYALRAYLFACRLCGQSTSFYKPPLERPITLKEAEREARSNGWAKVKAHGWVHKKCLEQLCT